MYKNTILLGFLLFTCVVCAQVPQGFNYQAVIRDSSGNPITNQNVGLQLTIKDGIFVATPLYTETFATTTSADGKVHITIGTGTTSDDFSTIDWNSSTMFIEIAADISGGTSYVPIELDELLSVPFAFHAGAASKMFSISDTDKDSRVILEGNPLDNSVRMDLGGRRRVYFWLNADGKTQIVLPGNFGNTFFGLAAGISTTTGWLNDFHGHMAGTSNTEGEFNVFVGQQSGQNNITGSYNVFNGAHSGNSNTGGNYNIFLGNEAGFNNTTGNENVYVGNRTGYTNSTGNGSIFLGNNAGFNETNSNRLYIENSISSQSLIYGEFDTDAVTFNGNSTATSQINANAGIFMAFAFQPGNSIGTLGNFISFGHSGSSEDYIGYQANNFYFGDSVGGADITPPNVYAQAFLSYSSRRWKHNIQPLRNSTNIIEQLQTVTYTWNKDRGGFDDFGFIAEQVHQILPQIAPKNNKGEIDGVAYGKLTPHLVEALKEQHRLLKKQQSGIEERQVSIKELEDENAQLKKFTAQLEIRLKLLETN